MRVAATLLALLFGATLWAGQGPARANTKQNTKPSAKELRWQGQIVRIDQKDSRLTVRGGQRNAEDIDRQIYYNNSTEWTKLGKPAKQKEFKQDSFVIVLGHADRKGVFHASRIDLRLPQ